MYHRCGLDLPTLMQIKKNSMAALANEHGWESMTEVEVQVASVKPNGDRIQLNLPLSAIPSKSKLRDPSQYDYEDGGMMMDEDDELLEDPFLGDPFNVRRISGAYCSQKGMIVRCQGLLDSTSHSHACITNAVQDVCPCASILCW